MMSMWKKEPVEGSPEEFEWRRYPVDEEPHPHDRFWLVIKLTPVIFCGAWVLVRVTMQAMFNRGGR